MPLGDILPLLAGGLGASLPTRYSVEGVKVTHTSALSPPPTFLVMSLAPKGGGATLTTGLRGAKPDESLRANGQFLLQPEGSARKTSRRRFPRPGRTPWAAGGQSWALELASGATGSLRRMNERLFPLAQKPCTEPSSPASPGWRELSSKLLPPADSAVQVQLFRRTYAAYFMTAGYFPPPPPPLLLSL